MRHHVIHWVKLSMRHNVIHWVKLSVRFRQPSETGTILLVKLEFLGYHIENQYNFVSYVKDTLIALVVNAEMFKYPFRLSAS